MEIVAAARNPVVARRAFADRDARSTWRFLAVSTLLFVASTLATIYWCASMSAMHDMPMPGGWTMSMMWMRMPGQTWAGAAASFVGMWTVMMVAMMLPSLVPALLRYRRAIGGGGEARLGRLTVLVGVGYFVVWTAFGVVAYPIGVGLAALAMRLPELAQAVPLVARVVVVIAGALQFTDWKARHLACCREMPVRFCCLPVSGGAAWRQGLRLGLHCCYCCAPMTAVLFVAGVMDLRAMGVVTVAISVERFAPNGLMLARSIGAALATSGLILVAPAIGMT